MPKLFDLKLQANFQMQFLKIWLDPLENFYLSLLQYLKKLKSLEAQAPDSLIQFDFSRIWIFDRGYPRLTSRDSLGYFRDRQEYFILDLKPFADPDSTALSPVLELSDDLQDGADTLAISSEADRSFNLL